LGVPVFEEQECWLKRIVFLLLLLLTCGHDARAQSAFYEDKTIRLVLGFSPGGISDLWGRALSRGMSQHIPGKPNIILQNMPGAGSLTAANYIYGVAKPDGLTIGFVTPGLYFNQLTDMKEVQFDWAKFTWIGSPERTVRIIYGRSDTPYKTLDDIRIAPEHPRCGATALGTVGHYFPRLIEEVAGVKFNIVTGYPAQRKSTWRCKKAKCSVAPAAWRAISVANRLAPGPRMDSPECWCMARRRVIRGCPMCPPCMR
jgi:tripartite-type tricarboxylate transporter receptor subunit TctC